MAAVTTLGTPTFNTTSGTHTVTATPAVGDLIVIVTASTGNTSTATPTDNNADGLGTYTTIATSKKAASADTMMIHVRNALVGSATSTVFTHAPGTSTGGGLDVLKVTGMTRVKGGAVRQSAVQQNQAAGGTPAPAFPKVPLSGNPIIGAVFNATNPATMTPRATYTELSDVGYNTPATGFEDMKLDSGESSATITWGSTSGSAFCDLAVELDTGTGATPALVQHVCGPVESGLGANSYKLQFANPSLAGNCIVAAVTTGSTNTVTVTDNQGNTYTAVTSVTGNQFVQIFIAPNATAGVLTITISFSAAQQFVQAVASEFLNVGVSTDGSGTGSGTAAAVATGSLTTTADGDLIYQVGWSDTGTALMTGWTQGTSPFKLLTADIATAAIGGCGVQYQVQASAGAITPSMTQAPGTNHFDTVAIALKSASAGTAPAAGIRIVSVYHATIAGTSTSPVALQFPCTGNLIVAATLMIDALDITAISDGNSNTWAFCGAGFSLAGSGKLRFAYAANATTSTTMTGPTFTFTGANTSGDTIVLYDVTGAATAPFDSTAGNPTASGADATAGSHTISTVAITPSTANGLVLSMMGVANPEPINAVTPGNLIACVASPEASSGDMDENNGWGIEYNTATSARTYVYTAPNGGAGNWAAMAVAFEAPTTGVTFSSFSDDGEQFRSSDLTPRILALDDWLPFTPLPPLPPLFEWDEPQRWQLNRDFQVSLTTGEEDTGLLPIIPGLAYDDDPSRSFEIRSKQDDEPWHTFFLIPVPPPTRGWDDWDWSRDFSAAYVKPPEAEPFDFTVPIVPALDWFEETQQLYGQTGLSALVALDEFVNAPAASIVFGPAPRGRSIRFGFSISSFR